MTTSDIKDQLRLFTDYELESIIETVSKEIDKRARARRENLKEVFFRAWKDLEEDGGVMYCDGEPIYPEEVEIEYCIE